MAVAGAVAGGNRERTGFCVWSEAGKNQCWGSVETGLWLWEQDVLVINFTTSTDNSSQLVDRRECKHSDEQLWRQNFLKPLNLIKKKKILDIEAWTKEGEYSEPSY